MKLFVKTESANMPLDGHLSAYLDFLRIGAALVVFLSHLGWRQISGGFLWQFHFVGHDGVILFFVLSGYVIAYATATKEHTLREYEIARFARLYSVVIPALILTYVFDYIGMHQQPATYVGVVEAKPFLRMLANALFLSQCWDWQWEMLSNIPFWSLSYEFWYYQLFAAAVFFTGYKRLLLIATAVLLTGPAIISYLPLWLAGVFAYQASTKYAASYRTGVALFVLSIVGIAFILVADTKGLTSRYEIRFLPRGIGVADYALGALIMVNLFSARIIKLPFHSKLFKPIAAGASFTFALYLLHLPLLYFIAAFMPKGLSTPERGFILIVFTLAAVNGLAFVTEKRKKEWRNLFRWLLNRRQQTVTLQS